MLSHLLVRKNGQIFVNAAGGDNYERVRRRAARIALRENKPVNHQLINKRNEYIQMDVCEAGRIMTPTVWIEELRDCLSDPIEPREVQSLALSTKREIVAELRKQRVELHKQCIDMDREISKIRKNLSV